MTITRKLYQEDVYRRECEGAILDMQGTGTKDDPFRLVLEETIFFPTGGGQPCDLGTIDGIAIADVSEKDGIVWHELHPVHQDDSSTPQTERWYIGARVACVLDWERRFDHMQRHCGEHILSGIFFREMGGVNRGFHMGSDYMTIDIDVPGITWEQALRIELLTNEVIWSNVPVTVRYYENRAEAEQLPLRKALAVDEDISIVCVGEEHNPADCVACCGTHPSTSGQVGLLKIFKLENYKGMTRVTFNAGKGAFEDYQNKHRILMDLNKKYSADGNDLPDKMKVQDEKNKEIRQELHLLKTTFIAKAADEILQSIGAQSAAEQQSSKLGNAAAELQSIGNTTLPGLVIRQYSYFGANDLLAVVKVLSENPGSKPSVKPGRNSVSHGTENNPLIVLISQREPIVILASAGGHDCGKIVKDNAPVWNGKGGGNAASARAMFPSAENMDCFVTFLRQAYSAK